ncbi:MAG: DUF3267 domain-containing protein [Anaerolineae bacterium]|nr:DUF3267 domain-containing protein [Anaerolineae bacterium]
MQNYDPSKLRDVSVPLNTIVAKALVPSIVLTIVPLIPHVLIWGFRAAFNVRDYLLGFVAVVLLVVAHEAVHALGWILFAGIAPKDIRFGIAWKTLSPYAHSMVAMPAGGYRVGVVLPLIVTGILPVVIGTGLNMAWLTIAGAILVSGAVGDLFVLQVIKAIPATALVIDHPENAGCYVVEP